MGIKHTGAVRGKNMFEETGQSKTLFFFPLLSKNGEEPFNNQKARGLTSRPEKKVAVGKLQ